MNKLHYEVKVDPKFHVLNNENTAIIQDDDMAKYDFNMDVEESWMENVTYDQLDTSDKDMLNEALHFHHEELEECFHNLRSPEDRQRPLDLMNCAVRRIAFLARVWKSQAARHFVLACTMASTL